MFYHHITGIRCSQIHSVRAVEEGWPTTATLSPSSRNLDCVGPGPGRSQVGTRSQDKLLSILLTTEFSFTGGILYLQVCSEESQEGEEACQENWFKTLEEAAKWWKQWHQVRLEKWKYEIHLKLVLLGSSCSSRTRLNFANHKIWWSF